MTDFESDYCGWDSDYYAWTTDGACVSSGNKTCNECGSTIPAGQEYHKWLSSEVGDHEDLEEGTLDWDNDTIAIEDHGEMLRNVVVVRNYSIDPHIMCEACYDLYDSLVASGRQPHFHEIHHCHADWKAHVKAETLDKWLSPLIHHINQMLRDTPLTEQAVDLADAHWEYIESVRKYS